MRLRHVVCDAWLRESRTLAHAIGHLKDAAFDPELYKKHEEAIVSQWNAEFPDQSITLKKRSWKRILSFAK